MTETIDIRVPAPLPHQRPIIDHPARFKVWRAGRRTGKTRCELHCATFGHGKGRWKGLVHGKDVAWVAPDFTQAGIVWDEDIKPRFEGVDGWTLSEKNRSLTLDGYGTLFLVSFENIRAIRGRGKDLGGVVIDEGAHFNLRYAWRSVIRPTLMDSQGWAFFGSTTNAGPDGSVDGNGQRQVPSFFNVLCEQILGGQRSAEWAHWHSDARQNPVIAPDEFTALVQEYDDDGETALREEVYAELLRGGTGLAFPEWDNTVHIARLEPEPDDQCAAGLDWGYGSKGWFGLVFTGSDNRLLLRHELYFDHTRAKKQGFLVGQLCLRVGARPEFIASDAACFSKTGVGATIGEKLQEGIELAYARHNAQAGAAEVAPLFVPAPKGPNAVANQTLLLHEVLGWERDKDGVLVEPPILRVHPDCKDFARTIAKIPTDRLDPNCFDTKGEDHPAQGLAYLLEMRAPDYRAPKVDRVIREARAKLDSLSRREADQADAAIEKAVKAFNRGNR